MLVRTMPYVTPTRNEGLSDQQRARTLACISPKFGSSAGTTRNNSGSRCCSASVSHSPCYHSSQLEQDAPFERTLNSERETSRESISSLDFKFSHCSFEEGVQLPNRQVEKAHSNLCLNSSWCSNTHPSQKYFQNYISSSVRSDLGHPVTSSSLQNQKEAISDRACKTNLSRAPNTRSNQGHIFNQSSGIGSEGTGQRRHFRSKSSYSNNRCQRDTPKTSKSFHHRVKSEILPSVTFPPDLVRQCPSDWARGRISPSNSSEGFCLNLSRPTHSYSTYVAMASSGFPSAHASLSDLIAASESFQTGTGSSQPSSLPDDREKDDPQQHQQQQQDLNNSHHQHPQIPINLTPTSAHTILKQKLPIIASTTPEKAPMNIDMAIESSPSADRITFDSPPRPKFVRHRSKTTGSVSKHDKTPQGLANRPPVQISFHHPTTGGSGSRTKSSRHAKSQSYNVNQRPHTAPNQPHRRTVTNPAPSFTTGYLSSRPMMATSLANASTFSGNPFEDPSLVGDVLSASRSGDSDHHILMPLHPLRSTSIGSKSTGLGDMFDQLPTLQMNETMSTNLSSVGGGRLGQSDSKLFEFDPLLNGGGLGSFGGGNASVGAIMASRADDTTATSHNASTTAAATAISLKELAAQLSEIKPRVANQEEELDLRKEDHRVTLGEEPKESTGTAKTHRRFYSGAKHVFKGGSGGGSSTASATGVHSTVPGNSMSLGVDEMGAVVTKLGTVAAGETDREHRRNMTHTGVGGGIFSKSLRGMGKKGKGESANASPTRTAGDLNNIGSNTSSPEKTKDLNMVLSNESIESGRSTFLARSESLKSPGSGRRKFLRLGGKDKDKKGGPSNPTSPISKPQHVTDANPSDTKKPTEEIQLRSSEQDPSQHQTEIPPQADFKFQANLCELLDTYRKVDQNFDFAVLIGLPRLDMEVFCNSNAKEYNRSRSSSPLRSRNNSDRVQTSNEKVIMQNLPPEPTSTVPSSILTQGSIATCQQTIIDAHKPILSSVIDAGDDLIVEGFYHEVNNLSHDTAQEKATVDRMEVAIFQSDKNRQFYVVYQGSCEAQIKPVRNRDQKAGTPINRFSIGGSSNADDVEFSTEQPVSVFPPFQKAYFSSNLEEKVFAKLDELAEKHPFFDVIITGHSFGGVLALLASMRYANFRPAIMVSCFALGCPKVGALNFRYYVHSLPNLKVMRLEYGSDPWINAPDSPNWTHTGHSIVITSAGGKNGDDKEALSEVAETNINKHPAAVPQVIAHKFGNYRLTSASASGKFKTLLSRQANRHEKQNDHDIVSYVHGIEMVSRAGAEWPKDFASEHGRGVHGLNKEKRLVV